MFFCLAQTDEDGEDSDDDDEATHDPTADGSEVAINFLGPFGVVTVNSSVVASRFIVFSLTNSIEQTISTNRQWTSAHPFRLWFYLQQVSRSVCSCIFSKRSPGQITQKRFISKLVHSHLFVATNCRYLVP